jgi:hypothetical protein
MKHITYSPKPWDVDPEMRRKLKIAGWRYAALTGVVTPEQLGEESITTDRNQFAQYYKRAGNESEEDAPGWDDDGAVAFVRDATGYDASICRMWLVYEWDIDVPHAGVQIQSATHN